MINKIFLASGSPRRRELIERLNIPFEVTPSDSDETFDVKLSIEDNLSRVSYLKAKAVLDKMGELKDGEIILAADTVVSYEGVIFGKPKSREHAFSMLKTLQGNVHEVYSGVTIISNSRNLSFTEVTKVEFNPMTNEEINNYIDTNEPMDKAGAYGIQGYSSLYIKKIDGDYYNVMGLPLSKTYMIMKKFF